MAQPNVVREPSMDEILASIRRIIESNDPIPGVPTGMPEPEGFSGSAANDDLEDVPLTIDDAFASLADVRPEPPRPAFAPSHPLQAREERIEPMSQARLHAAQQAEDAPVQPTAAAQELAAQPKSLSLADVAARVRAASERNPGLRDLAPRHVEEDVATSAAPPASSPLMTGRMATAGGAAQPEPPVAHQSAPQIERENVDWNDIALRADHGQPAEEQPATAKAELETMISPPVMQQPAANETAVPTSLISMDAGQQVARSFQDLAVAIDEAERRSYDEIAADLLRPMLQEWLDENLPTLVERLVREEIERVARGNRR
ncbi:DUF2497 domain-containing protein [Rhizobium sp.]